MSVWSGLSSLSGLLWPGRLSVISFACLSVLAWTGLVSRSGLEWSGLVRYGLVRSDSSTCLSYLAASAGLRVCAFVSLCPRASAPVHLCTCAPVRLCACAPVRLCACACAPVRQCAYPPARLRARMSACLSASTSLCPSLSVSVCPSVRLSVWSSLPVSVCAPAPDCGLTMMRKTLMATTAMAAIRRR